MAVVILGQIKVVHGPHQPTSVVDPKETIATN